MYIEHSLKFAPGELHGQETRQRTCAVATTSIPHNWADFRKYSDNKKELFAFLTDQIVGMALPVGNEVFITSNDKVKCNPLDKDISRISPCTHDEGNICMFVHVKDAVLCGHTSIMLRTVDTDVVILAISIVQDLNIQLWIFIKVQLILNGM